MGYEGFEFEGVPFLKSVLLEIEEVYYLWSVLGDEASGVADVVAFVKAVAGAALGVAVLFIESGGHVAAVDKVPAVHLVEVVYPATGDAAYIAVLVGIAQADVAGECFVEVTDEGFLTPFLHCVGTCLTLGWRGERR